MHGNHKEERLIGPYPLVHYVPAALSPSNGEQALPETPEDRFVHHPWEDDEYAVDVGVSDKAGHAMPASASYFFLSTHCSALCSVEKEHSTVSGHVDVATAAEVGLGNLTEKFQHSKT